MAVLKFDPNAPVEIALKFDGGKQVQSRIPDAPDQMLFSVVGGNTIYVPLHVAEQIAEQGIRKLELFSICKTVRNNITKWEVKRLNGETAKTEPVQPQRALHTPATAHQNAPAVDQGAQIHPNSTPIHHTVVSKIMASALIAAFDATEEAQRYAHSKGVDFEFGTEDIRAIANTIFIALSKDGLQFAAAIARNEGAQPWQQ